MDTVLAERLAAWHPRGNARRIGFITLHAVTVGSWLDLTAAGIWDAPLLPTPPPWQLRAWAWRHSPGYGGSRILHTIALSLVSRITLHGELREHANEPFNEIPLNIKAKDDGTRSIYRENGIAPHVNVIAELLPMPLKDIREMSLSAAFQLMRYQRMIDDPKFAPKLHPIYQEMLCPNSTYSQ